MYEGDSDDSTGEHEMVRASLRGGGGAQQQLHDEFGLPPRPQTQHGRGQIATQLVSNQPYDEVLELSSDEDDETDEHDSEHVIDHTLIASPRASVAAAANHSSAGSANGMMMPRPATAGHRDEQGRSRPPAAHPDPGPIFSEPDPTPAIPDHTSYTSADRPQAVPPRAASSVGGRGGPSPGPSAGGARPNSSAGTRAQPTQSREREIGRGSEIQRSVQQTDSDYLASDADYAYSAQPRNDTKRSGGPAASTSSRPQQQQQQPQPQPRHHGDEDEADDDDEDDDDEDGEMHAAMAVPPELQRLFQFIGEYEPEAVELPCTLRPFFPEFIPTIGESVNQLHRIHGAGTFKYSKRMPDATELLQEWKPHESQVLQSIPLPGSEIDLPLRTYAQLVCNLCDIPVYNNVIESLHLLFTVLLDFKANQGLTNAVVDGHGTIAYEAANAPAVPSELTNGDTENFLSLDS